MTTQEDCACTNSKCFEQEQEQEECPCEICDCGQDSKCDEDCGCDNVEYCNTDSSDEFDDENNSILRGKWIYDGSTTIDEMIECLQREIILLTDLKTDGWYVSHKVEDDYAFIRRGVDTLPDTA
jgi:hypothetical protein